MMPRLGEIYDIEIETLSKSPAEYHTDEYFELDLPVAPAVMVGDDIVVEGSDVSETKLKEIICKHLGIDPPHRQKERPLKNVQFYSRPRKAKILTI